LSGRNFAVGRGFGLEYKGNFTQPWVPALYSLVLSGGYIFWHHPAAFYVINILLGIGGIVLLAKTLQNIVSSRLAQIVGLGVYLLHGYIMLLASLPMSENLLLFLFILAIYLLLDVPQNITKRIIGIGALAGLILTKYTVVPVVIVLSMAWFYSVWTTKQSPTLKYSLLGTLGLLAALFTGMLNRLGTNPWLLFTKLAGYLATDNPFYNFAFVVPNTTSYFLFLSGFKNHFLWFSYPFTSISILIAGLAGLLLSIYSKKDTYLVGILSASFLAQFSLLLIFYTVDSRYIIIAIPLLALATALAFQRLSEFPKLHTQHLVVLLCLVFLPLTLSQVPVFRYLLSANILHTTKAWQLESVKHFDTFFKDTPNQLLITALPPYYVDAYQKSDYRVLPLSLAQEFATNKKIYPWGNHINYNDLTQEFTKLLAENKRIYISNAYITHSQTVISDFEKYKEVFDLTLVSQGCQDACNIYTLTLKDHD
jgi:hypothetical protein